MVNGWETDALQKAFRKNRWIFLGTDRRCYTCDIWTLAEKLQGKVDKCRKMTLL